MVTEKELADMYKDNMFVFRGLPISFKQSDKIVRDYLINRQLLIGNSIDHDRLRELLFIDD